MSDIAKRSRYQPQPPEGHNQPCYYCGEPCNALAGNPGKWPLAFPHRDEPGVVKWQHVGCVVARLTENQPVGIARGKVSGDTSDGYHTFNELYEHRHALFSVICNAFDGWKSLKHADGTTFDGWFIAGCQTEKGQITYHLPLVWWDKFSCRVVENAPEWDGHTPADVIDRVQTLKVAPGIAEAVKAAEEATYLKIVSAFESADNPTFQDMGKWFRKNSKPPSGYLDRYVASKVRETKEEIKSLQSYKFALEHHLCKFDLIDWLACNGGHGDYCDVCESQGQDHPHQTLRKVEKERDAAFTSLKQVMKEQERLVREAKIAAYERVAEYYRDLPDEDDFVCGVRSMAEAERKEGGQ